MGLADKLAVGEAIFTVAVLVVVPPIPVAVIVNVVFVVGDTLFEPLRAVLPIDGLKLTDVAPSVLQERVLEAPRFIIVGPAEKLTAGGSGAYSSNSPTMTWQTGAS